MSDQTKAKRAYVWHIPSDRRAALNKERYEHMRRGREAKRAARKETTVNTTVEPTKDTQ